MHGILFLLPLWRLLFRIKRFLSEEFIEVSFGVQRCSELSNLVSLICHKDGATSEFYVEPRRSEYSEPLNNKWGSVIKERGGGILGGRGAPAPRADSALRAPHTAPPRAKFTTTPQQNKFARAILFALIRVLKTPAIWNFVLCCVMTDRHCARIRRAVCSFRI